VGDISSNTFSESFIRGNNVCYIAPLEEESKVSEAEGDASSGEQTTGMKQTMKQQV